MSQSTRQGIAEAENNLGIMYDTGHGVPQNYAKAAHWYRLAAHQGFATAENNLGALYQGAPGVPKNYLKAYFWFDLAAANGDTTSATNRDNLARFMTPAEIAEAQNRASRYASKYK